MVIEIDPQNVVENFECSRCGKLYSTKSNLTRHTRDFCKARTELDLSDNQLPDQNLDHIDSIEEHVFTNVKHTNHIVSNDQKLSSTKIVKNNEFKQNKNQIEYELNTPTKFTQNCGAIDCTTICCYCNKDFSRKDSLIRHQKNGCKAKSTLSQQEQMILMQTEMQKLKNEIIELRQKNDSAVCISNNNNNNKITNNNNNYDIKIMAFGKEDLYDLISDADAKKYIKTGYQSVYNLIEDFHFNENHPERQNIYISNMKDPYAYVFDGDKWNIITKDEAVDQLFDDKQCFLIATYKDIKDTVPSRSREKFERFMNESDKAIIDNLKKEIKLMLYNKSHIPIKTKNEMKLMIKEKFKSTAQQYSEFN